MLAGTFLLTHASRPYMRQLIMHLQFSIFHRNRLRVKKVDYGRFSVNKSKIIVMALLSLFAYS